jgi:hypothetical protein
MSERAEKEAPDAVNKPRPVAIVAMGNSSSAFISAKITRTNRGLLPDDMEVWAINTMGSLIQCDRIYHMDPVSVWLDGHEWTAENEAHGRDVKVEAWPSFAKDLMSATTPIYTAKPDERVPASVRYPIEEVMEKLKGFPYFNTTVAYALAHAIAEDRPEIHLYGCDFTYREAQVSEAGKACAEFWIAHAMARGISVRIPQCTLLDNWRDRRVLYGFGCTYEELIDEKHEHHGDGDGRD